MANVENFFGQALFVPALTTACFRRICAPPRAFVGYELIKVIRDFNALAVGLIGSACHGLRFDIRCPRVAGFKSKNRCGTQPIG